MTLSAREQVALDRHDPDAFGMGSEDDCWNCGGEGYVHDCIDGCCVDAESGCEDCTRRCSECARREYDRLRGIRISIIHALDIVAAIAFAKQCGRWRPDMDERFVLLNLHAARVGCPEFSDEERTASACWVEGLL